LRYMFVYGPGQTPKHGYPSVIVKNFLRMLGGERPLIHGDGAQVLDYVFVDDVVAATILALAPAGDSRIYNVGSGEGTAIRGVVAPCFNEGDNVQELVDRLNAMFARRGLRGEVVLVDDASTDATPTVLRQLAQSVSNLVVCTHPVNRGIEAAWRTGLKAARGT